MSNPIRILFLLDLWACGNKLKKFHNLKIRIFNWLNFFKSKVFYQIISNNKPNLLILNNATRKSRIAKTYSSLKYTTSNTEDGKYSGIFANTVTFWPLTDYQMPTDISNWNMIIQNLLSVAFVESYLKLNTMVIFISNLNILRLILRIWKRTINILFLL